jgi:hypothetical protein
MNLNDTLPTIAILLPGYFGAWVMGFALGVRKRDWQLMVVYSLVFSALTYLFLLIVTPKFISFFSLSSETGFQRALNEVSNLGDSKYKLTFHNTVQLLPIASIISILLGGISGQIGRSTWFTNLVLRSTDRTLNLDIWSDFHQRFHTGPHTVILKNNDCYFGNIVMVSDTLTGNDRGIILDRPLYINDPVKARINGVDPGTTQMPGKVLIFADQIASIYNMEHPHFTRRNTRNRKVLKGKTFIARNIRAVRKAYRKLFP